MPARTHDGRSLRLLVVLDEYTRQCPVARRGPPGSARSTCWSVCRTFSCAVACQSTSARITAQSLRRRRSGSGSLGSASGPSTSSRGAPGRTGGHTPAGRDRREPGGPEPYGEGNGYVESLIGKLRDELLDREIFDTLLEAKVLVERWRRHYNHVRPHSALGYRPPAPEAIEPLPAGSGPLRQPAMAAQTLT